MPRYRYQDRPTCSVEGCNTQAALKQDYYDGYAIYRLVCGRHHKYACAERAGLSLAQWTNTFHPYRKYRKSYCENKDARLGYQCTTTIVIDAQLEVDHINGNPSDNDPLNLQTLCACCHKYKTLINEDHKTPGRASLGVS